MNCWYLIRIAVAGLAVCPTVLAEDTSPESVFASRIKPIFDSPDPSSCVQCHLSAVDLKDYILPSSVDTFLSLRAQGMINTDSPSESKILHLIAMGDSDPDALSRRIHAKNRKAEFEAFAAWIKACCSDEELLAREPPKSPSAGPAVSNAVIRHSRKDRVLDSFIRNVWSQRMRCFPCHTPAELNVDNPMHKKPIERHRDFVKKYGARMNIFKATPRETMRTLITDSRKLREDQLPLINIAEPRESLLVLKPTAKLPPKTASGELEQPSSIVPVSHMGGIKMHKGDQSYKAWMMWLEDYAKSITNEYGSEDQLPRDNWYPTQHVIRIKGLPEDWPSFEKVQIFVHRWNPDSNEWSDTPAAFTQAVVTPRKIVNGSLFVLASSDQRALLSSEGTDLKPSRVQLKLYLDRDKRLEDSPVLLLNDRKPDAITEADAKFGVGFKNADVIEGVSELTK